jgi:hypothetical protein
VAWGAITGTLSDQTDLQSALDALAPLASPVFTGTITAPTIKFTSTSGGIVAHNQVDEVTNYERATWDWVSNVFTLDVAKGGSGTLRNLEIKANGATLTIGNHPVAGGAFDVTKTGAFQNTFSIRGTNTLASGIFSANAIYPTINQSGTASYNALFICPYEQALGSGQSYLIRAMTSATADAQGGYTELFRVTNAGAIWAASSITAVGATLTGTVVLPSTTSIGSVSSTELGYLDGVTGALQTQIDGKQASLSGTGFVKISGSTISYDNSTYLTTSTATSTYAPLASPTFTGTVVLPATTSIGTITNTELGYLSGVTSNIQDQLDSLTKVFYWSGSVVNNNGTANTLADVTGLLIALASGKTYRFKVSVWFTSAASTTGSRWTINGPTNSMLNYYSQVDTAVSGLTFFTGIQGYNSASITPSASSTTTSNRAVIEGIITTTASGNLQVRFSSEISSSAITALYGWIEYTVLA